MGKGIIDNAKMVNALTPMIKDINLMISPQLIAAYNAGFEDGLVAGRKEKKQ